MVLYHVLSRLAFQIVMSTCFKFRFTKDVRFGICLRFSFFFFFCFVLFLEEFSISSPLPLCVSCGSSGIFTWIIDEPETKTSLRCLNRKEKKIKETWKSPLNPDKYATNQQFVTKDRKWRNGGRLYCMELSAWIFISLGWLWKWESLRVERN